MAFRGIVSQDKCERQEVPTFLNARTWTYGNFDEALAAEGRSGTDGGGQGTAIPRILRRVGAGRGGVFASAPRG